MGKGSIPPCYKYIARTITTEDERHLYSHNYFENMTKNHVARSDAEMLFLINKTALSCGKPLSIGGMDFALDEYLEQISDIAGVETLLCGKYYKSVMHPDSKNMLCSICAFSKSYANNEYENECRVFKYLCSSKDNFNQVNEMIPPGIFRSAFDIAEGLNSNVPAVVPLLRIAFETLVDNHGLFFSEADIKSGLQALVGKITVQATQNKNVQIVQAVDFRALPVSWERVVSDISLAEDVSYQDFCAIVSRLDKEYCHKDKKPKKKQNSSKSTAKIESQPLFEMSIMHKDDVEDGPVDNGAQSQTVIEKDDIPDIIMGPDPSEPMADAEIVATSFDTTPLGTDDLGNIEPQDIDTPPEIEAPDDIPESAITKSTDADVSSTKVTSTENVEAKADETPAAVSAETTAANTEIGSGTNGKPPAAPLPKAKKYSIPPYSEDSYIYSIELTKKWLKKYALPYSEYEAKVFKSIMKSQILPCEIVFDDSSSAYLLIYVRPMRTFFYIPIDSDMPKTIQACMKSASVRKICYQPYYLYSLFRIYDVRLRNVFSLASADRVMHPDVMLCTYMDFFKVFHNTFEATEISTGVDELDCLLYNMQGYILIQAMFDRSIKSQTALADMFAVDEVLGTSFLRIINLKSNDYLFELKADGVIEYNKELDYVARHDGFFVSYTVGVDDAPGIKREELYMGALVELSKKGRIYKFNIQLVTITGNTMVLFIGIDAYELLSTALQKYFNHYAIKHKLERFDLDIAHQRVYANSSDRNIKKVILPNTLDDALDLLVTGNASVTVSEDRIVKRTKSGKNKRTKQTQNFVPKK